MRRRSRISLTTRTALLRYGRSLPEREAEAIDRNAAGPIWFYWGRGLEEAPPVVRICLQRQCEFAGSRKVVFLDDASVSQFIELPSQVMAKRAAMGPTHFSDVLRSALLAEQGGTWVDATVYLTGEIPAEITRAPFFAFSRESNPYLLSSWFIHAQPGQPSMLAERDMLFAYWQDHDALVDYYLFHFLFECGVTLDRTLRSAWERVPDVDYAPSQRLQDWLLEPFDEARFAGIRDQTPIHKLTWKLDAPAAVGPRTFYDVLIRDAR